MKTKHAAIAGLTMLILTALAAVNEAYAGEPEGLQKQVRDGLATGAAIVTPVFVSKPARISDVSIAVRKFCKGARPQYSIHQDKPIKIGSRLRIFFLCKDKLKTKTFAFKRYLKLESRTHH